MMARRLLDLRGWRAAWVWAIVLTVGLRVGVGLMMAVAWLTILPYLNPAILADSKIYDGLPTYTHFPANLLLGVWQRWDANHYLNLARLGYFGVSQGDSVFYPLYPVLVSLTAIVVGDTYVLAGLVVSTVAAIAAFACLYRLADRYYGSTTAQWAALALAVYPTSLFLIAPFTESLFLALTLGAFLAAADERWVLAGVLGALGSLTRGPGVLTVAALAWIGWRQWRDSPGLGRAARIGIGLALPVAGAGMFLLWRSVVGFPPVSDILRTYSGLEMVDPLRGLYYVAWQLTTTPNQDTALDVTSGIVFIGLTGAMVVNPRWRRGEWIIYTITNLGVFFSKHSFVASSIQSMSRYVLVLFPCFMLLGDWLAARSGRTRFIYVLASSIALMLLSALYTMWFFVG